MILLAQALLLLAMSASPQEKSPQEKYLGWQECGTCHEDISKAFQKNPHLKAPRVCESCHGPGREHGESADIELIRSFRVLTPEKASATCLDCHQKDNTHSNRLSNAHSKNAVSCTTCHSIHSGLPQTTLLVKPTNTLCATCHSGERARFNLPFSHKLSVGAINCADCHSPHGGLPSTSAQLLPSHGNESGCLNCHGDKRGPFAFEHMPVKVAGCTGCHAPHGSTNPRMLIRSEVRLLCLECHTNSKSALGSTPPAFHDLRSDRYKNCTTCHTKIHGSHVSRALLR